MLCFQQLYGSGSKSLKKGIVHWKLSGSPTLSRYMLYIYIETWLFRSDFNKEKLLLTSNLIPFLSSVDDHILKNNHELVKICVIFFLKKQDLSDDIKISYMI